jgi:hypothetical protein
VTMRIISTGQITIPRPEHADTRDTESSISI